MLDDFLSALLVLFLLINPLGLTPVFLALTSGTPEAYKRQMALKGCFVAWCILMVFAFVGFPLLKALGISLEAFRVGGGLLLGITGLRMVMEQRQQRQQQKAEEHHAQSLEDISVFPIATLFLAGPGAITAMMLMMHEFGTTLVGKLYLVMALTIVIIGAALVFVLSGKLAKYLPETIVTVIGRVLGILLLALSVQFIFDGISATFLTAGKL